VRKIVAKRHRADFCIATIQGAMLMARWKEVGRPSKLRDGSSWPTAGNVCSETRRISTGRRPGPRREF